MNSANKTTALVLSTLLLGCDDSGSSTRPAASVPSCVAEPCSSAPPPSVGGAGTSGSSSGGAMAGGATSGGAPAAAGGESSGGTAGVINGGAASGGSGGAPLEETPQRPLSVDSSLPQAFECEFTVAEADARVPTDDTYNGKQFAHFDSGAPKLLGKLVVALAGAGAVNAGGGALARFTAGRGFHAIGIAYVNDYGIVRGDADFYGDARLEAFEGVDHTPDLTVERQNSIEERLVLGLKYLQQVQPKADWAYYLTEAGQVRWADVVLTGISHGGSTAPRVAMVRKVHRVVSAAGPRDNNCKDDPACVGGVVATWLDETALTPIDRFYALTGKNDGQFGEHLFAFEKLGYVGAVVDIDTASPPYDGSHRLMSSQGGHEEFCGKSQYEAACNYAFGVPEENRAAAASPSAECNK